MKVHTGVGTADPVNLTERSEDISARYQRCKILPANGHANSSAEDPWSWET